MVEKTIVIKNKSGLHARPAALFVQTANKYDSDINVTKGKQRVNGKSIMGILMLAAEKGETITVSANGHDALDAVKELSDLLLSDTDLKFTRKGKRK
ncbi:MAG: HPr family phosphocarrier protein [Candidatus Omnitrophica bacterium]|nr:HPr family phosphocarrier protein [Candidatus Omnitrophota bacterium]